MNVLQEHKKPKNILFIILSVIGLFYEIYLLSDYLVFTLSASETQGQIIARDGTSFTIQYTVEGHTFRIKHDLPSTKGMSIIRRERLRPGATVAVLYDPLSPSNARWNADNWLWPLIVIFLSILFGLAGFFPDLARKSFGRGDGVAI
ncbi:MAG: DUF3592 domain-containing protein [Candidatus Kryptoniota bacterium]